MHRPLTNAPGDGAIINYYMLYYDLVPDILTARGPYMEEHRALLDEFASRGLVFAGLEMTEGFPGVFMFAAQTDGIVKEWLRRDPYFTRKLVTAHRYHQLKLVAGSLTAPGAYHGPVENT